ncbi:MAG: hypothetical protein V1794_04965 [Candidatus Glassbacteria bacterium]
MSLFRKAGFRLAELFLATPASEIQQAVALKAGSPVRLERYFTGSGWGIKYLVYPAGAESPGWVVKASSGLIEFRLKLVEKKKYVPPAERFRRECRLLAALEKIGLGPSVLLCEDGYFVRGFIDGTCLADLPPLEIAGHVEPVLRSIEKMAAENVFHTDPNAANVIVRRDGPGYCFIDSELPGREDPEGRLAVARRIYCHERLLHSLGPDKLKLPVHVASKVMSVAVNLFDRMGEDCPVPPARVASLMSGSASPLIFPG